MVSWYGVGSMEYFAGSFDACGVDAVCGSVAVEEYVVEYSSVGGGGG